MQYLTHQGSNEWKCKFIWKQVDNRQKKKCIYLKGFPLQKVFHQSQHERFTEAATIVVQEARLHSELAAELGSIGHVVVVTLKT